MMSLIHGIQKIIQMNVCAKQKQIPDIENKLVVTKLEWKGGRGKLRVWD